MSCLALLAALPATAQETAPSKEAPEAGEDFSYPTMAELVARAEASDVMYELRISPLAEPEPPPPPKPGQPPPTRARSVVHFPRVVLTPEGRALEEWTCSEAATAELERAEAAFGEERWQEAAALYRETVELDEKCYVALAHLGDAFFKRDLYQDAEREYSRAISINPLDHRTWTYRAHARYRLGKIDDAIADLTEAFTLRPGYWVAVSMLEHLPLPVVYDPPAIEPPVVVERVGPKKIEIAVVGTVDDIEKNVAWMAYGLCKGLALGEAGVAGEIAAEATEQERRGKKRRNRRRSRRAKAEPPPEETAAPAESSEDDSVSFEVALEHRCLLATLDTYANGREPEDNEPPTPADPNLDRLIDVAKDGRLDEAILYQAGIDRFAEVTLLLDDAVRDLMREYVSRHVLEPR